MSDIDRDASEFAEQVLLDHESRIDASGWRCTCGHRHGHPANLGYEIQVHRLESAYRVTCVREILAELDAAHAQIAARDREIEQTRRDAVDMIERTREGIALRLSAAAERASGFAAGSVGDARAGAFRDAVDIARGVDQ